MTARIPVVDLFAGAGGLGEGFASLVAEDQSMVFDVVLSVERDEAAHKALELRKFFHQFPRGKAPEEYYQLLRGEKSIAALYEAYPEQAAEARQRAWQAERGPDLPDAEMDRRIRRALGLGNAPKPSHPAGTSAARAGCRDTSEDPIG